MKHILKIVIRYRNGTIINKKYEQLGNLSEIKDQIITEMSKDKRITGLKIIDFNQLLRAYIKELIKRTSGSDGQEATRLTYQIRRSRYYKKVTILMDYETKATFLIDFEGNIYPDALKYKAKVSSGNLFDDDNGFSAIEGMVIG